MSFHGAHSLVASPGSVLWALEAVTQSDTDNRIDLLILY